MNIIDQFLDHRFVLADLKKIKRKGGIIGFVKLDILGILRGT